MSEKLCLQWNDFKDNVTSAFGSLRGSKDFADVTLVCEDGKQLKVHKVILAASSPFFHNLLTQNVHSHPLIFMRGVKSVDLMAIVDFLYIGETNVSQENLDSFLAVAEELELKGLTEEEKKENIPVCQEATPVYKKEANISKSSMSKQTLGKTCDATVGTLALSSQFSGDLQDLNEKTNSMMEKMSKKNAAGKTIFRCKVCGKEAPFSSDIKKHIESHHLEGVSIPCNTCEKVFRSRNSLSQHNHREHKGVKDILHKTSIF